MKRCPQCEFIYEDDQNLCDMDGKALVYEARQPDLPRATTTKAKLPMQKSRLRSVVPLVAGLILATVLFLIFYASPHLLAKPESPAQKPATKNSPERQKPETNPQPATEPPAGKPAPTATKSPTSDTTSEEFEARSSRTTRTNHTTPKPTDSPLTISQRLPPLPRVQPLPRLPEAKVAEKRADPISVPRKPTVANSKPVETQRSSTQRPVAVIQKRESKVSSFLKKTGRMISKPFKF